MQLTVRKLGVLSLGKIMGALYALFGLIIGAIFSLVSMLGFAAGMASGNGGEDAIFGFFFGVGAIIILPIFYGVFGFIGGLLTALFFNLIAGLVGGLELDVDSDQAGGGTAGAASTPGPPSYG